MESAIVAFFVTGASKYFRKLVIIQSWNVVQKLTVRKNLLLKGKYVHCSVRKRLKNIIGKFRFYNVLQYCLFLEFC